MSRRVRQRLEIGFVLVRPAGGEALHDSTAAFRETRVAKFAVKAEDLPPRRVHGFLDGGIGGSGQALVALAMVVGADIEIAVLRVVIPFLV